jgi:hypothetical protein
MAVTPERGNENGNGQQTYYTGTKINPGKMVGFSHLTPP